MELTRTAAEERFWRADLLYAVAIFVTAGVALTFAIRGNGGVLQAHDPGVAVFFLLYGLFTITIGYPHPNFGYVSFDRVAQIAAILVLGPVDAAWINGLASLIYPWHRLWKGVPLQSVLLASLNNAGLMSLIVLLSGSLYVSLGGAIPLTELTPGSILLLLILTVSMQLLNDASMLALLHFSRAKVADFFNLFSVALEISSGAVAILVAIVYNMMPIETFVLLLAVLSLGMVGLQQFAKIRYRLEALVEERTKSLREKTLELERQATQDKLTGLFNRRYADTYLERALQTSRRYGQPLTVALADLDRFKQINDHYSHVMGDEVLRRVAQIFRERCRTTDMIARYGGEEFLLCFPQTEAKRAGQICEELRAAIESDDWSAIGLSSALVTISFGIAQGGAESTRLSLIGAADERLYEAKNSGRNLVAS